MSKVAWKFYAARRGFDLYELIYSGYFKSHEQYCTWCLGRDIEPLTKDEYATYSAEVEKTKPKPKKPVVKKPVTKAKPAAVKKPVAKVKPVAAKKPAPAKKPAVKKPVAKLKAAPIRAKRVVAKDED